jgi:phosphatidyl-myo-inositol alpha-mannosyltransferase
VSVRGMRIALVHPHSWPEVRRGGERYLYDLAWYLTGAGHTVEVITGTDAEPATAGEGGATVRKHRHITPPRLEARGISRDETFALRAFPALMRRRYDIVHAMTPTAAIAARLTGHRVVFTVLGHPNATHLARHARDRRLFATALRLATVPAALSRASADACASLLGRQAVVLPPGLRTDRFPAELRARTGPARVLFSAHAGDRRKGVQHALGALGMLLERRPDARLLLSGAGDPDWAFELLGDGAAPVAAATDRLGAGRIEDVPATYRDATVTVLPSAEEAFGLALVESLASGTPAVCSDSGGMPEILDDPCVGAVVPLGDVPALAAALDRVIDLAADPATPARCAAHARRFDWLTSVGPQHEAIYRDAIGRRRFLTG